MAGRQAKDREGERADNPVVRIAPDVVFGEAYWRIRSKVLNRLACFPFHSTSASHLQCSECCASIKVDVAGVSERLSEDEVRSKFKVVGEYNLLYKTKDATTKANQSWTTPEQTPPHEAIYLGRKEPLVCTYAIETPNAFPFEMSHVAQVRYTVQLLAIQDDGRWKSVSSHSSRPFIVRHMHRSTTNYPDPTVKAGRPPSSSTKVRNSAVAPSSSQETMTMSSSETMTMSSQETTATPSSETMTMSSQGTTATPSQVAAAPIPSQVAAAPRPSPETTATPSQVAAAPRPSRETAAPRRSQETAAPSRARVSTPSPALAAAKKARRDSEQKNQAHAATECGGTPVMTVRPPSTTEINVSKREAELHELYGLVYTEFTYAFPLSYRELSHEHYYESRTIPGE